MFNSKNETSENYEVMTFQFSESKQPVRNVLIDQKPWFVGKDVCDVLGLQNNRQAIRELDDDEKLMYKIYTSGQNRDTWLISESGLYALIFRSSKPYAKTFRKWVTSEVIPSLLKKGYYGMNNQKKTDFIDARDVPYTTEIFMEYNIRVIWISGEKFYSLNDINSAIRSTTGANQISKKLNAKQVLARKIWIFGNTNPAWFVNHLGLQLVLSGSRIFTRSSQLTIDFAS